MDEYTYDEDTTTYVCAYCDHAYFINKDGLHDIDKATLEQYNATMFDSLGKDYWPKSKYHTLNPERLDKAVNDILRIKPNDLLANFFYAFNRKANDKKLQNYHSALERIHKYRDSLSTSDYECVLSLATKTASLREEDIVSSIIDDHPDEHRKKTLKKDLQSAIETKQERDTLYANIQRDVFICHSSKDESIVKDVLNALENDGYKCWVAFRNIPEAAPDYDQKIERSVELCDIFLVIGSKFAMDSASVRGEIDYAQRVKKPRIEYKIDKSNHTVPFSYFFGEKGYAFQSIDASDEKKLGTLVRAVMKLSKTINEHPRYSIEAFKSLEVEPDTQPEVNQKSDNLSQADQGLNYENDIYAQKTKRAMEEFIDSLDLQSYSEAFSSELMHQKNEFLSSLNKIMHDLMAPDEFEEAANQLFQEYNDIFVFMIKKEHLIKQAKVVHDHPTPIENVLKRAESNYELDYLATINGLEDDDIE